MAASLQTESPGVTQSFTNPAVRSECRAAIRAGSKSFSLASVFLPADVRWSAQAIYAFCRSADDVIDLSADPAAGHQTLIHRLDQIYAGQPGPDPADRAFAEVAFQFAIPKDIPEAMLMGFRWDVDGRRYERFSDVLDYCVRVASTVGVMMALVMGVRRHPILARACELGMAMQLTNIARDVGEDARNGRLYLPGEWLRHEGIDPDEWLANPQFSPSLANVIARLLQEADKLYQRAADGISSLPVGCRPAINAARLIYAEIGRELERRRLDSVNQRAVTSTSRKAWLLAGACGQTFVPQKVSLHPTPVEARFLIDAVCEDWSFQKTAPKRRAWWNMAGAFEDIFELLLHLEQQQQVGELDAG